MNIYRLLIGLTAFLLPTQLLAEDIEFADATVKALCVANWDTDKDGELSVDEAAAVDDLGTVFREQKGITTFDELKFFTGLTVISDYAFFKSSIQRMTLPPTVTSIGEYAFSESSISGEVHIPGNVKTISDYAFYNCQQLTKVVLGEGVETVGWHTFSGPIQVLSLPSSLTFMRPMAIDPYVNADPTSGVFIPEGDLYVYVQSPTPAQINSFAFYYVFSEAHLLVPHGCVDVYKAEDGWSHFGEYIEVGDVNRDGKLNVADVALLIAYVTGREYTEIEARIADVNGDGVLDGEDVRQLCQHLLGLKFLHFLH